ncbi:MAG: sulfatase-like hydrolase/transferase [Planctomycetes bacterium]|nr:sulfatase-like hydrolase/transferase [Planctomycetota bacterium]
MRLATWIVVPALLFATVLRCVLHARFATERSPVVLASELSFGVLLDVLVALVFAAPLLAVLFAFPLRFLAKTWVRATLFTSLYAGLVFHAFVQLFFFEEFSARFNHIALDYVLFPGEVVGNIWESYDVPLYVGLALAVGGLTAAAMIRDTREIDFAPPKLARRIASAFGVLVVGALAVVVLAWMPLNLASDRVQGELTSNGTLQLARAYFTGSLSFDQYYRTLPLADARRRAATVLGFDAPTDAELALPAGAFAPRRTATKTTPRDWNVLVVLEESLGSEFVGTLGAERGYTPELDRWAREGTLLTQLIATGNRTVRGLESVLSSFVPLPGDAIAKRHKSENVATLARFFAARGWTTEFFYGGHGIFDGMKPFMLANGWQRFVEQSDFPDDTFATAWGVADQYEFDALLARQREAHAQGEKLFATLLSVSNHKPYDIPPDSPMYKEGKRSRERAVAYADWSLGRYLDGARDAGILADTVVLIVGDHGARVYGSADIPAGSYRIPALFLSPDPAARGVRIDRLCSQIDLGPTLLGLCGFATPPPFLGSDVRGLAADGGRAFVQHNRDFGIVADDALVVLGLQKTVAHYRRASKASNDFVRVEDAAVDAHLRELEADAIAVFQLADELYEHRQYRLEEPKPASEPRPSY